MKVIITFLFILIFTPLFLFAQELSITENSEVVECERTLRVDGIWIYNGIMKADISILTQKNSKPITGGYGTGDILEIKKGCSYYIQEIIKYGQNSNYGQVVLTKEYKVFDYLNKRLSTLDLNEKFNIGGEQWTVNRISKDEANFEIKNGLNLKTVTLNKGDLIWNGFTPYYISDFLANTSAKLNEQWTIELKQIKDYSYLNANTHSFQRDDINARIIGFDSPTMLIIRKMRYYPKQKFNQEEYDATPVKYWVLKLFFYHTGIGHQMMEVEQLEQKMNVEFEGYKSFDTEAEVMEFARVNGITDIMLTE